MDDKIITTEDAALHSVRYCGRIFSHREIERIRRLIASNPQSNRVQLSRLVCEALRWIRPDGRLKEMSCRVAMLRMHRDGRIALPPPQSRNGNRNNRPRLTSVSDPQPTIDIPTHDLGKLLFRPVENRRDACLWNELIERYHYLGYKTLPGAQIRYLIFADDKLLAVMGFGAAAWKIAPRDRFVGWSAQQRVQNLHLVVNNARFLILPWIRSKCLASRILAGAARQLPHHWQSRYGYKPLLLETFVLTERFRGTCYRAANWIHVGQTQGRGKLDRKKQFLLPVKEIFLYPLNKHFRKSLCGAPTKGDQRCTMQQSLSP